MRSWVGLLVSVALVAVVAVGGAALTNPGLGPWYDGLVKPSWTPPPWLFGPVWTTLYLTMAIAAWVVGRKAERPAAPLGLYATQLALNLAWSGIFFTLRRPDWAVVEIVVLLVAIVATIRAFAKVSRGAALALVPYVAWVAFATALNASIALANPRGA
jgi:tryptophan-rich sensory protein